jgi:glycolate oxidase subunit GlcD
MITERFIKKMEEIVGKEYVRTSEADMELYSYDASLVGGKPGLVVFPGTTEEVSRIMREAYNAGIPNVGRGFATNLSGGTIIRFEGLVVALSRFNRILEIHPESKYAVVQTAVTNLEVQEAVSPLGMFYAPDPASQKVSTIGGNIGENSGGPHCLKYGVTTNHVLGMEIVLNDGTVVWTGGKCPDQPGYDIKGLLVGSEGTLGLATQIMLRLERTPEAVKTMLAIYDTIQDGANTVSAIIAEGIVPATLEMMDNIVMRAVEETIKVGYPLDAAAVLIIELDGMPEGMDAHAERIMEICRKNNVREVKLAKDDKERAILWAGRKGAFGAVGQVRPSYVCCDGTVPRTRLPEVLSKVLEVGKKYDVPIGNVFHAGDGNLHPLIMFDDRDPEEKARVLKASSEILKLCADAGGTISGEHGVGLEKIGETCFIFSDNDLELERSIKHAFDPDDILNPGKLIPDQPCAR